MLRIRLSFLSLAAVCAVGMFSAAVASAAGPFWHVNGSKLTQGSRSIKLQSKGDLVLGGTITAKPENIVIVITCKNSTSDGTIDGQGAEKQGQDKGVVTFTSCSVATLPVIAGCKVAEPIKTGQLKSHLAFATVQEKEQIVDLFEPAPTQQTEEKVFARVNLQNCAGATGVWPVKGSIAAQIQPQEEEVQQGSLYFPGPPITKVKHEGQEVSVGLTFAGNAAEFVGFYGASLQPLEKWGVFRT